MIINLSLPASAAGQTASLIYYIIYDDNKPLPSCERRGKNSYSYILIR